MFVYELSGSGFESSCSHIGHFVCNFQDVRLVVSFGAYRKLPFDLQSFFISVTEQFHFIPLGITLFHLVLLVFHVF